MTTRDDADAVTGAVCKLIGAVLGSNRVGLPDGRVTRARKDLEVTLMDLVGHEAAAPQGEPDPEPSITHPDTGEDLRPGCPACGHETTLWECTHMVPFGGAL